MEITNAEAAELYRKGYRWTVITDTRVGKVVSHHRSEIMALNKVVKGYGLWLRKITDDGDFVDCGFRDEAEVREQLAYLRRVARNR